MSLVDDVRGAPYDPSSKRWAALLDHIRIVCTSTTSVGVLPLLLRWLCHSRCGSRAGIRPAHRGRVGMNIHYSAGAGLHITFSLHSSPRRAVLLLYFQLISEPLVLLLDLHDLHVSLFDRRILPRDSRLEPCAFHFPPGQFFLRFVQFHLQTSARLLQAGMDLLPLPCIV
jgi:hypothetical protein